MDADKPCSLARRMTTMFYDSLLLTAVLFLATFAVISFTDGNAVESNNIFYKLFLLLLSYLYFVWHWMKGGQTLGMRSWHVRVIDDAGQCPDLKQASLRFIAAFLSWALVGLGYVWSLFDKEKRALHDRISKTRLIVVKKNK